MSLGTFVYQTFFKPTSWLRYHFYHFGLKGTYAYYLGEAEMKKAAMQLPAIIAYDGNAVDYDALEYKTKQLFQNYFQKGPGPMEQTLMSYILFTQNGVPLNQNDYKIYYDNKIDDLDNAVLRHYIFKAKLPYFSNQWKKIRH